MSNDDTSEPTASQDSLAMPRLIVGLLQGVILLLMIKAAEAHAWPSTVPWLYAGLVAVLAFVPPTILAGAGQMRPTTLALWSLGTAGVLFYIAWHAITRDEKVGDGTFPAVLLGGAAVFVAYHLVAAADQDRRLFARYLTYFDVGWKNGVQLALSLMFVGAFWLLLFLGAALFSLLKIEILWDLLRSDWFAWPASSVMFALAVHISDMRVGLIAGARALALVLLSWLLPVMSLIAVAFLAMLPATGLEPLWATGNATTLLLISALALVLLINAAYQHGDDDHRPPLAIRLATRAAGLALLPIVAIAAYSVWLRIDQYGLTPDRVSGAAFVAVASCYAVGYAFAAIWPGRWMKPLEITNVLAAIVMTGIIVSLLTPIADPARIAVNDQVRRLQAGLIAPEKFDFEFLRYRSAHYGVEALKRLATDTGSPLAATIAEKAKTALAAVPGAVPPQPKPQDLLAKIVVYPTGSALPESFIKQDWTNVLYSPTACASENTPPQQCEAYLANVDGDGAAEVLVSWGYRISVFRLGADGTWTLIGSIEPGTCGRTTDEVRAALRTGHVRPLPAQVPDIEIEGRRVRLQGCAP